jgi:preprotein translocase subunit SecY
MRQQQGAQLSTLDVLGEIKGRLLFLLFGILIFRLGAHIPVPGVDVQKLSTLFTSSSHGILAMFNVFSGGALAKLTVFALGVVPYISSSIIMSILSAMLPKFQQMRKEGEAGRRRINRITRIGTVVLAVFQSLGIAKWLAAQGMTYDTDLLFYFTAVVTLTTGTMFLMWLGEQMTERGIGNGISLIIFLGIVSRLPEAIGEVVNQVKEGQMQSITMILLMIVVFFVIAYVVYMERAQRRIAIHYAQRQQGRHQANSTHLPLKVNMAGVIPPIFASSLIVFPSSIAGWLSSSPKFAWLSVVTAQMRPGEPIYIILFVIAIVFFAYFYTALIFNPKETADDLKRTGAFLPGIRPGDLTAKYIDSVMSRLTLVGAIYLCLVSLLPQFLIMAWHVPFYFGGTSLLIVVVVVMDFITQIQSLIIGKKYAKVLNRRGKSTRRNRG